MIKTAGESPYFEASYKSQLRQERGAVSGNRGSKHGLLTTLEPAVKMTKVAKNFWKQIWKHVNVQEPCQKSMLPKKKSIGSVSLRCRDSSGLCHNNFAMNVWRCV